MKYPNIVDAFYNRPLAILPAKALEIERFIATVERGVELTIEEKEDAVASTAFPPTGDHSEVPEPAVGLVSIVGSLSNRASYFASGGSNYQSVTDQILTLADDEQVQAIVLDIDSPGGAVNGVSSVVDAVRHAKTKKPVIAVANDMMASAAYWIGSQADKLVVSPTSTIGSIGVIAIHTEYSKYDAEKGITSTVLTAGKNKGIGNDVEPLTDDAKAVIQAELDEIHAEFKRGVNAGRFGGAATEETMDKLSQGDVWRGQEAVALGLADSIGSLHQTLTSVMNKSTQDAPSQVPTAQVEGIDELRATVATLQESVTSLTQLVTVQVEERKAAAQAQVRRDAERLVDEAISAGKFLPASRDALVAEAEKNFESFSAIVASVAPNSVAALNKDMTPKGTRRVEPDGDLSEAERQVFGQLGLLDDKGNVALANITHESNLADEDVQLAVNKQLGLA